MITVLIADDHMMVRNLIQLLLEKAGDIQIVAMASTGQETVDKAVLYRPNVVVIDLSIPPFVLFIVAIAISVIGLLNLPNFTSSNGEQGSLTSAPELCAARAGLSFSTSSRG